MVKKQEVLWSRVLDLRSQLSQTGSLPSSISRDDICHDLAQALTSPSLTNHQKYEVRFTCIVYYECNRNGKFGG